MRSSSMLVKKACSFTAPTISSSIDFSGYQPFTPLEDVSRGNNGTVPAQIRTSCAVPASSRPATRCTILKESASLAM